MWAMISLVVSYRPSSMISWGKVYTEAHECLDGKSHSIRHGFVPANRLE